MKKLLLIALFGLASFQYASALDASVSYATFNAPGQPFIELHLHIVGSSVTFLPIDSLYMQADVEVLILFKQGETIIKFDKFNLKSPAFTGRFDFVDLRRYGLDNGAYELEITIQDIHEPTNQQAYKTDLIVDYAGAQLQQSDIQLLASFEKAAAENPLAKNGYFLEWLPFNFYSRKYEYLSFYNEIYRADQAIGEDFMVSYSIEEVLGNGDTKTALIGHKRKSADPVVVLLLQIDISKLPSGNYHLLVEVRDRHKELLSQRRVFFQRSNPYLQLDAEMLTDTSLADEFVGRLSEDELRYSLKAIAPVANAMDGELINALIKDKNIGGQRQYLFTYWAKKNPNQPEVAYNEYMEVARAVDVTYQSGLGFGFESDRGWTFMKYGKPDDIITEWNDPSAPPYEIWSYNYFPQTNQSNIRFIFYNPSLAGGDFRLLHSNARGELNNPQWEVELYRDDPNGLEGNNFIDGTEMQDNFNRQAKRRFRDN